MEIRELSSRNGRFSSLIVVSANDRMIITNSLAHLKSRRIKEQSFLKKLMEIRFRKQPGDQERERNL